MKCQVHGNALTSAQSAPSAECGRTTGGRKLGAANAWMVNRMGLDTEWVSRQKYAKSYKKMIRPTLAEEDHLRETIDEALKATPFYGHRLMTRARNIYVDRLMDQHYLDYQEELNREQAERSA